MCVAAHHALDRVDGRAGREQRDLVGVRRRVGVGVERDRAARRLRHPLRGSRRVVDPRELLARSPRAAPRPRRPRAPRAATTSITSARSGRSGWPGGVWCSAKRSDADRGSRAHDAAREARSCVPTTRASERARRPADRAIVGTAISSDADRTRAHVRSICSARASSACSLAPVARAASSPRLGIGGTSNGSPIAMATVANGLGICVRSQLFSVQ